MKCKYFVERQYPKADCRDKIAQLKNQVQEQGYCVVLDEYQRPQGILTPQIFYNHENGLAGDFVSSVPLLDESCDIRLAQSKIIEGKLNLALIFDGSIFLGPLLLQTTIQAIIELDQEVDETTQLLKEQTRNNQLNLQEYQRRALDLMLESQLWQTIFTQSGSPACLFDLEGKLIKQSDRCKEIHRLIKEESPSLGKIFNSQALAEFFKELNRKGERLYPLPLKNHALPWIGNLSLIKSDNHQYILCQYWVSARDVADPVLIKGKKPEPMDQDNMQWVTSELNRILPILGDLTPNLYTIPDSKPEHRLMKELLSHMLEIENDLKQLRDQTLAAINNPNPVL